jgi:hypothetical protein
VGNRVFGQHGGAQALDIVAALRDRGIKVNFLVTLDPVSEWWVSAQECGKWVNVYQAQTFADWFGFIPVVGPVVINGTLSGIGNGVAAIGGGGDSSDWIASTGGQLGSEDGAENYEVDFPHLNATAYMGEAIKHLSELVSRGILR